MFWLIQRLNRYYDYLSLKKRFIFMIMILLAPVTILLGAVLDGPVEDFFDFISWFFLAFGFFFLIYVRKINYTITEKKALKYFNAQWLKECFSKDETYLYLMYRYSFGNFAMLFEFDCIVFNKKENTVQKTRVRIPPDSFVILERAKIKEEEKDFFNSKLASGLLMEDPFQLKEDEK